VWSPARPDRRTVADGGARRPPHEPSALQLVSLAALIGTAVGVGTAVGTAVTAAYGALLGWDVAALVYVVVVWRLSWGLDPQDTARAAERQDPTRPLADLILLIASVASLVAVAFAIADSAHSQGLAKGLHVALAVASVMSSWFLVHTVFTARYAREYFDGEDGGIDFNTDGPPRWSDFAYLSFTVGMTFQVSDTDLQTPWMRRLALGHMLVSYLFGAVIIAVVINLVAGLSR
jgi:uncharacterized membrane protein